MAKYKVGDELIVVNDPNEDNAKLKELTTLNVDGDFAQISWGIKILEVEYDMPNVTLTYKNVNGKKSVTLFEKKFYKVSTYRKFNSFPKKLAFIFSLAFGGSVVAAPILNNVQYNGANVSVNQVGNATNVLGTLAGAFVIIDEDVPQEVQPPVKSESIPVITSSNPRA